MSEMKAPLQIFLSFNIITVLAAIIEEQEPARVLLETEEAFPSLNLELIMSAPLKYPSVGHDVVITVFKGYPDFMQARYQSLVSLVCRTQWRTLGCQPSE